jgi:hypothetical protein
MQPAEHRDTRMHGRHQVERMQLKQEWLQEVTPAQLPMLPDVPPHKQ